MTKCALCYKYSKDVLRHLKFTHKKTMCFKEPTTLKEFIQLCQLFPLNSIEWKNICKSEMSINKFVDKDTALPNDIAVLLYEAFERYKISPLPRLQLISIEQYVSKQPKPRDSNGKQQQQQQQQQ
jgi:hypothetical protein